MEMDEFSSDGSPGFSSSVVALKILLGSFETLGLLEVRLPQRKLAELRELIRQRQGRRSCLMNDLESLVGTLAHAAQVVPPGKTFLRCMFELKAAVRHVKGKFRLNSGFKSDVLWWATFLESWNGTSKIAGQTWQEARTHIWTDVSGSYGCGVWDPASGEWIQLAVDRQTRMDEESISTKELLPIVLACATWGKHWVG